MAERKKALTPEEKREKSFQLFSFLEQSELFAKAHVVLLYYSLPDEVYTHEFIEKWAEEKTLILPVVKGEELELHPYTRKDDLKIGSFHIMEPDSPIFVNEKKIELAVVPGVSFDTAGNRLGRGKGYYDRLLPRIPTAYKAGICFPFQLVEEVPAESFDVRMDIIITINEDELSHPYHPLPSCDRE